MATSGAPAPPTFPGSASACSCQCEERRGERRQALHVPVVVCLYRAPPPPHRPGALPAMAMDTSGKEKEALQLLAEADRKVRGSQGFFSGLFG